MMKKYMSILYGGLFIVMIIFVSSCANLDEEIYSSIVPDNFYSTDEEILSTMAPAYSDFPEILTSMSLIDMEELTTDIIVQTTRDYGGCYGGGVFQRFHEHTWTAETNGIPNIWANSYRLINRANMLIFQFEQFKNFDAELKERFISELRVIRAFGYYYLLNAFGNVPIIDRFDVEQGFKPTNESDFYEGRQKVFDFIEEELIVSIPNLSAASDLTTYGRFNKWAAMTILLKLYMNAEVWTGTARWDDAISISDEIIDSGNYELERDYFTNFLKENNISKENIFVIPFHPTLTPWWMTFQGFAGHHHSMAGPVYNAPVGGNNCRCALPSFIQSFNTNDNRLKGWAIGPQINRVTGDTVLSNRPPYYPLIYTADFVNIFDPNDNVQRTYKNALDYNGARFSKYEVNYDAGTQMSNSWVIYRYADVLLMKAEALMRKNGNVANQTALDLVNQVRSRAFDNPNGNLFSTIDLTLDELLAERGREFYYEGMRRNDLIRFDKFARGEWEWFDRSNQGDHTNWFPIPQSQINANNNLYQNPGY